MFRLTLKCPHNGCEREEVLLNSTTIDSGSDTLIFEFLCASTGHKFFGVMRQDWRRDPIDRHYYANDRKVVFEVGVTMEDVRPTAYIPAIPQQPSRP